MMGLEKEIERAVRKIISLERNNPPKSDSEIVTDVKTALCHSTFNFENTTSLVLKQNVKKRFVKQYVDTYSVENILCQCIKQILDRTFKIKYPNRNKITKDLFSIFPAVIQMSDFTIVKFDFKDYFNSISSIYAFEKYIKPALSNRREIDLIKEFVYSTKYTYAGLCTSNSIAEIIAQKFDDAIRETFFSNGMIFYQRYIDDSVLILNEQMDESDIKEKLNLILLNVFHDKNIQGLTCRTKFNEKKFKYISRRKILSNSDSIDFLGYKFLLSIGDTGKIQIKYGITEDKRKKYEKRIDKLICAYKDPSSPDYQNLELLRHRIAAFSSREVYMTKHFRSNVWKVKGFISNYGELRYYLDSNLIEKDTEDYLKNMINEAFKRAEIIPPYFLKNDAELNRGYNLYQNMKVNKTILLVDHIGYDYKSLVKLCEQIEIDPTTANNELRSYDSLVREYLIKLKVGY